MTQTVILWPLRRPPLQASSKTGPFFFFFWRGGWDGWIGGRGKAREFRRVGSLALVGGDLGACCCFIPPTCFSSLLVPGNNPLRKKRPHRGSRCEIRWEVSQWADYFSGWFVWWCAVWSAAPGQTCSPLWRFWATLVDRKENLIVQLELDFIQVSLLEE